MERQWKKRGQAIIMEKEEKAEKRRRKIKKIKLKLDLSLVPTDVLDQLV